MPSSGSVADADPGYLVGRIRERLAVDPRTNELEISVRVHGRLVVAEGTVASDERRDSIGAVIHEMLPEYEVRNEVRVAHYEPAETPEEVS